jgi:ABC-2 type transport system permease protein
MFSTALYRREMKSIWKMLVIFAAILTMYVPLIVTMYDSEMLGALEIVSEMMPGLMDAMGFSMADTSLIGYMSSYLYGFILIACPMIFSILCAHTVICNHVDKGSMVSLLAAPVKRLAVAFTQMKTLATGIIALVVYTTALQLTVSEVSLPGELEIPKLMMMNAGLLSLHLFIGGVCFFFSCLFSEAKYSLGFGAGITFSMFVLQMLGNVGGNAEKAKYFTFFTLFNPDGLAAGESGAVIGMLILFAGALALFGGAITIFSRKDLHI